MRWKRGNRLQLVGEENAPPRTRQIFDEVRHSLGVSDVPVLYQAYAAFPQFLQLHWAAVCPAIRSRQFFALGARLAAESYTRAHNYFQVTSLSACERPEDTHKLPISQVLDYYQYLDPLLLLISSAQMQAFEGAVGVSGVPEPSNHPQFPVAPDLLDDAHAGSVIHRIWEERRRVLELAFISEEHRALACWPDFYRQYWSSLKHILQSPLYVDCQYRLGESAMTMVRELPVRVETGVSRLLEAGMEAEELSSLVRINEAFMQAMTGLVLDVTFARIACDGGTQGQSPDHTQPSTAVPSHKQSSAAVSRKKRKSPTRAA